MRKSAIGIIFSLFFVIFIMSNADAAGISGPINKSTKNTVAKKKESGAKKKVTVAKQASARNTKPRSKSVAHNSTRLSKARKTAIVESRQKSGFHQAAYGPARSSATQDAEHAARLSLSRDPLDLKSNVALVMDQRTSEVLFEKNSQLALPIASITKLMTSLVVIEGQQNMDEILTVTEEDIDREKHTHSRLRIGSQLTRANMLHIALMSSENRAASALGRHYPGGLPAFVAAMNAKAAALGMKNTRFVEPTGLSSNNISTARDLAKLVTAASRHPIIRHYSTDNQYAVEPGGATLHYKNSNTLVTSPDWEINLQKTGYISEAGRCLVMQVTIEGRPIIMVFLDSKGKLSRLADASRVRKWLENTKPSVLSEAAPAVKG